DQEPGSDPLQRAVALRDLAVLELLYSSGLRVSELVALDRSGIDRGQRTVRVTGKGAKERIVPVGAPALDAIARWEREGLPVLAEEGDGRAGEALFLGVRWGRLGDRAVRALLDRHAARAGVPPHISPHALRDSAPAPVPGSSPVLPGRARAAGTRRDPPGARPPGPGPLRGTRSSAEALTTRSGPRQQDARASDSEQRQRIEVRPCLPRTQVQAVLAGAVRVRRVGRLEHPEALAFLDRLAVADFRRHR